MTEYALYDGDAFVMIGTVGELAEYMGVKPATVLYYTTETALKRRENAEWYKWAVVKIED